MNTFEEDYSNWLQVNRARFDGLDDRTMIDIFAGGYNAGFESAKHCALASIANALAPEAKP